MSAPGDLKPGDIVPDVTYEDLALLESEFDDAELDEIRWATKRFAPLYAKRATVISKIPNFWALVFEGAPPEFDQFIQPSDSQVFADALTSVHVERFEIEDPEGSPRSVQITFEFAENEYFSNKTLVKKFWFRRSSDDWTGLVSEPVAIDWKEGKDLTAGLNKATLALWKARAAAAKGTKETELPEFKEFVKCMELGEADEVQSFFTWFSFVSSTRWVSAEESKEANRKDAENRLKAKDGVEEDVPDLVPTEEIMELEMDILSEVHGAGEDIAQMLADDIWPNCTKYFTSTSFDDEDLSELDEEMLDDEDDSEGEEVDIRALVGKGKKDSNSPPPPKKRKA